MKTCLISQKIYYLKICRENKVPWLRPSFPSPFDESIIGADPFHDSVRDVKRWFQIAQVTRANDIIKKHN